jgi:hypothetical protein
VVYTADLWFEKFSSYNQKAADIYMVAGFMKHRNISASMLA